MHQGPSPTANTSLAEEGSTCSVESFSKTLLRHGLELVRGQTGTLQINVGLLCNQACRHCHLDAGPNRSEIMSRETMKEIVAYAARVEFPVVDITGGAPEMNPHLGYLIEAIAPMTSRLMLRANLTALALRTPTSSYDCVKNIAWSSWGRFPRSTLRRPTPSEAKGCWSRASPC